MSHRSDKLELSVVVVNYNTAELTRDCVRSVVTHTSNSHYEVIVVDNASADTSPLEELARKEMRVTLVKSPKNLGFAGGNNLGIEHAGGEHILLLNSDTVLVNDAIAAALNELRSAEDVGAVSAKLVFPDGRIQFVCRRFPSIGMEVAVALRLHKLLPAKKRATWLQGGYFDHQTRLETDAIWGTFFLFRKKTLQLFPGGRLSETFFMYGEDMEWCYVMKKCGLRIVYAPAAEVIHYMGGSGFESGSGGTGATIYGNRIRFLRTHRGSVYALAFAVARYLNLLVSSGAGRAEELTNARAMFGAWREG
jgi:GT2 family glycosyltransferase